MKLQFCRKNTSKDTREQGFYLVLLSGSIVAIFILLGFAVDSGTLFLARARVQRAADAGAYAGMANMIDTLALEGEITASTLISRVENIVKINLRTNGVENSDIILPIEIRLCKDETCPPGSLIDSSETISATNKNVPVAISVNPQTNVPLRILGLFPGYNDQVVGSSSSSGSLATRKPIALAITADMSGSMGAKDIDTGDVTPSGDPIYISRITAFKETLAALTNSLNTEADFVTYTSFAEFGRVHFRIQDPSTPNFEGFKDFVNNDFPTAWGGDTNMALGIKLASNSLSDITDTTHPSVKKVALLFTDGGATAFSAAFVEASPGLQTHQTGGGGGGTYNYDGNPYSRNFNPSNTFSTPLDWQKNYYYVDARGNPATYFQIKEFEIRSDSQGDSFRLTPLYDQSNYSTYFQDYRLYDKDTSSPQSPLHTAASRNDFETEIELTTNFCGNYPLTQPTPLPSYWHNEAWLKSKSIWPINDTTGAFITEDTFPDFVEILNEYTDYKGDTVVGKLYRNVFPPVAGTDAHCLADSAGHGDNNCFWHPQHGDTIIPGINPVCPPEDGTYDSIFPKSQYRSMEYQSKQSTFAEADYARSQGISIYTIGFGTKPRYIRNIDDPGQNINSPGFPQVRDPDGHYRQNHPISHVTAFQEMIWQYGVPEIFMRRLANDRLGKHDPKYQRFNYNVAGDLEGKYIYAKHYSNETAFELKRALTNMVRQIQLDNLKLTQ